MRRKIDKYDIDARQMYNMDEKGFLIGVAQKSKRIFSRQLLEAGTLGNTQQDGNREWVTAISWNPDHVTYIAKHWCGPRPIRWCDDTSELYNRDIGIDRELSLLFSLQGSNSIACICADGTSLVTSFHLSGYFWSNSRHLATGF